MTNGDWLAAVESGHPPPPFGHREHLKLAWLVLAGEPDLDRACERVSATIHRLAVAHGHPQKYHRTVTDAWVRIVAHCRAQRPNTTFEELLQANGWLFHNRLLLQHYRSTTLASPQARTGWVAPDLLPIPA
jgi:hypothetical protein